jgi:hypothetical protein
MPVIPDLAGQRVACPECGGRFVMAGAPLQPIEPPRIEPAPVSSEQPERTSSTRGATLSSFRTFSQQVVRRRFVESKSFWDILDFKFEKYLTPWIVRVSWATALVVALMWLVVLTFGLLMSIIPTPETDTRNGSSPRTAPQEYDRSARPGWHFDLSPVREYSAKTALAIVAYLTAIIGCVVSLLWIRVVLECVIVIFNIAQTLTSIDASIKPPSA